MYKHNKRARVGQLTQNYELYISSKTQQVTLNYLWIIILVNAKVKKILALIIE